MLFWIVALGVFPLFAFVVGAVADSADADALAWVLILGLPPLATVLAERTLGVRAAHVAVGAVLSTAVAFSYVLLLLWYLFEVVGVS